MTDPGYIYLDYQATTPLAPSVVAAMQPFLQQDHFANPHAVDHAVGRAAKTVVEQARGQIATAVRARASTVMFTGSATEANNTAIVGIMRQYDSGHLIISAAEHACVLEPARALQQLGYSLTIVPVSAGGLVDPDVVRAALRPETRLVSVHWVNNEIGTIQPIAKIATLCRTRGVLMHTDAAQALGRVAVDVQKADVDLMTLASHKAYGPKAIGALYVRRGIKILPLLLGGGQERQIRSGTLSPMLCAGFGVAAELAAQSVKKDQIQAAELTSALLTLLRGADVEFSINGTMSPRAADNLNLHFPNITQQALWANIPKLAVSGASACTAGHGGSSHVLRAIGREETETAANMRISVGRPTTRAEIVQAAAMLAAAVKATVI